MHQLSEFKDKYKGRSCTILGNGPSLKEVPNWALEKLTTFGTNKIFLKDGFLPKWYVAVNPLVIEQNLKEIGNIAKDRYVFVPKEYAGAFLHSIPMNMTGVRQFSPDASKYIYQGWTVTMACLQLAYYFGFNKITLLGVDHHFENVGAPNAETVSQGPDINHFSPDYFGEGVRWNFPDLKKSEEDYKIALKFLTKNGVEVVNMTKGSDLDVFPKE